MSRFKYVSGDLNLEHAQESLILDVLSYSERKSFPYLSNDKLRK